MTNFIAPDDMPHGGMHAVEGYHRSLELLEAQNPGSFAFYNYKRGRPARFPSERTSDSIDLVFGQCPCGRPHPVFHVTSVDGTTHLATPCPKNGEIHAYVPLKANVRVTRPELVRSTRPFLPG